MGLWLTKTQPFRPRAVQCTICFTIGHRADVCPTAHEFTRCETCGQQFPPAQRPDQTAHECEVRCFNCEGPHGARDPRCPKKQQADKLTRLAAERRRLKTTSKDSGQPKNRQKSQSIATNPPKKNDQNYPSLPLHNRFEALRDTTPDPKSEPRPRSGSLPGYPTKRSTPPPPPPKPKTPSFVRALLSQKPPAHSEEPPQKQPRHSSPEKEALHGGDAMDGHVTTSTPGKTLQPKRWKPKVVPKIEEGHECQSQCLVCGGPHLMGSADCTWRKPDRRKSSNKRHARGARKDAGPGTQAQKQVAAASPLPETRAIRQGPQGSSRPADNHKIGGAGAGSAKTTGSKVSWAEVAASSAPTLAAEKLKEENSRLRQELAKYKTQKLSGSAEGAGVPETPTESAMEERASLPPTQQAPATQVAEKREEENINVVARETDKTAAVTREEARIEVDVERCLQRELPRLEARIAQDMQASHERTLQTIIERSVQAAIERGSHGAVERVLRGILEPHLIKLQAFGIRIDRKLQELADCTRAKVLKLTGRMDNRQLARSSRFARHCSGNTRCGFLEYSRFIFYCSKRKRPGTKSCLEAA
ncbi:hypothetical protein HPB49_006022 [Dermacentor silvarum]|uniref:Uncharacterized protein n=1 Tax=Dermacentor silvarum TaxID=543639 RepID=A0ACB8C7I8_DERSI|nr:hypothetical protein HPB49_006022 [Dermacentor silvarum]